MTYPRHLHSHISTSLEESPVVLLTGPRQSGKTTLMTQIGRELGFDFISFDSIASQSAALRDPVGFVDSLRKPVILDEVQRVPEIFLPIKVDVDQNRHINGRYALTGSANPLLVPKLGDALTGRMLLMQLWPLSQGELIGKEESFLDRVFADDFGPIQVIPFSKQELLGKVCLGGFPGMHAARSARARQAWCDSYLSLALQKDVQELAQIEGLAQMPKLLQLFATRVGSTLNYSDFANSADIPLTSLRRYTQLLHSLFILHSVQPWSRNLGKRLTKAPKVYFIDTGILLYTLNFDEQRLEGMPSIFGGVAENFVVNEILKQVTWSRKRVQVFYCRLRDGQAEIDIILEDERGKVVGIEVKTSETPRSDDFKHLRALKEAVGSDFLRGIVLYSGKDKVPFGDGNWAVPISHLWNP